MDGANERKVVNLIGAEVTIAEPVIESRTQTIYEQIVFMDVDDLADTDDVAAVLEDLRDRADYALEMVKNDSIEVVKIFYDKNPHGYGLVFETSDEDAAREAALYKAVGNLLGNTLTAQVKAKYPTDELARTKAYEVLAAEVAPKQVQP